MKTRSPAARLPPRQPSADGDNHRARDRSHRCLPDRVNRPNDNAAARAKAVKLEALLRAEGLPLPTSLSVFSSSLGTNGGVVCAASGYNLTDAILNQQNSASTGAKTGSVLPVEKAVLNGKLAIIPVYCPARAPAFIKHFGGYKLYDLTP